MTNRAEIEKLLRLKLEVLEIISRNNETQCRFISRWEMRGLGRLLRQRGELISRLAAMDRELAEATDWEQDQELASLARTVAVKQLTVMNESRRLVEEATGEREKIGIALNEARTKRQARKSYLKQWEDRKPGIRLNVKG